MTIRWDCKKSDCYITKNLPDWSMLDGCFGITKVSPSDIDGVVYQSGKCLFLEKKFPIGVIGPPQLRMINSLISQGNSMIAIWCQSKDGSDISYMQVWGVKGYDQNLRTKACLDDFRAAVCAWWRAAYYSESALLKLAGRKIAP